MLQLLSFLLKTLSYNFAFQQAKKKGLLIYLKVLQIARKSLLFSFVIFLFLQTMILGFIGAVATGIWLLPVEDLKTKLWILFSTFGILFLIPLIIVMILFSERTWYKLSGLDKLD
jgi:hypothetical protein